MTIPLTTDAHGAIHVSGTRVTLETLIARYQQGESPETIHASFSTVPLHDVYAIIAYYLAHRHVVEAYMHRRDVEAECLRQKLEAHATPAQRARQAHLHTLAAATRRE
jgi:uncharacterized protein (DUF433 family)